MEGPAKGRLCRESTQDTWLEVLRNFGSRWGDRIGRVGVLGRVSADLQRLMGQDAPSSFAELQSHLPPEKRQATVIHAIDEAQCLHNGRIDCARRVSPVDS